MIDTTTPVTGDIEARLREILAEELNKFDRDGKLAIEYAHLPEYKILYQSDLIKAALAAMRRVALDRASGDRVNWHQIADERSAEIIRLRAALSAVSIPRREVE